MSPSKIYLHGCRYVLGEEERPVAGIEGLAGFLRRHQMAGDARLWGWDRFRATRRSVVTLAVDTARQTLAAGDRPARSIDAAIFCATRFPLDVDSHADVVGRLLEPLGLRHAIPYGVTLNRCATLLAGLILAEALIISGRHRAILVAASDTMDDDLSRLRHFAIFSDGAASCVVAGEPGDFELAATAGAADMVQMKPNGEISAELGRQVNEALSARSGIAVAGIRRLAHNNLFKPIVVMKELQAGFRPDQLFLDNIGRTGHVSACDPLVNLVDMIEQGAVLPGDAVALSSSVSGARFGAFLRKT